MHWTLGSSDGLMSRAESAEDTCDAGRTGTTPAEPQMKATCAAKPEIVWFQSPVVLTLTLSNAASFQPDGASRLS